MAGGGGYKLFGTFVKSEYLALGTYALTGLGIFAATRKSGPETKVDKIKEFVKDAGKEEEDLADSIRKFLADAEAEAKKVVAH